MEYQGQVHLTVNWGGVVSGQVYIINRAKTKGMTQRCGTVWDMLWVSGDEGGEGGRQVNEVERVDVGEKECGWGMLIGAVNALTCNIFSTNGAFMFRQM